MAREPDDEGEVRRLRAARMEAFSDGVFAIAITLLVLDIAVPAGSGDQLLSAIGQQWPVYVAYVVSFASIGAAWLAHTVITDCLAGATAILLRLNLLLLLVVSFLPFPTRLLAEYIDEPSAERAAVTVYGVCLFLVGVMVYVVWRYAVAEGLVRQDIADRDIQLLTVKLTPGLAGYLVMIVLGIFLPTAAVFGYLVIALFYIVPFRALRGRRREVGQA